MLAPAWPRAEVRTDDLVVRAGLRRGPLRVEHLEALVATGGNWPPLLVQRASLVVIDGRYRLHAARQLGLATVAAEFFDGDDEAALFEALRRNVAHGLPLTLAERKAAAAQVLGSHREWSDAKVAQSCGLSAKTVARLRLVHPVRDPERRLGRDGRYRPTAPGAARARVAQLLAVDQDASLRTIAARAGVSHETVRHVRKELASAACDPPAATAPLVLGAGAPEQADLEAPKAWCEDSACASTEAGAAFAAFFDAHALDPADLVAHAAEIPLSRLYEVIDESRLRARLWGDFADLLARRVR